MIRLGRRTGSGKRSSPVLNAAGRAGPRRLLILAISGVSLAGLAVVALSRTIDPPRLSVDSGRRGVDPLPGGFISTPEQDAVAYHADSKAATAALESGRSFTPPLSPSIRLVNGKRVEADAPPPPRNLPLPQPLPSAAPPPPVYADPMILPAVARVTEATPPPVATKVQYAPPRNDPQQQAYDQHVRDLLNQWGSRAPQTDVILPPPETRTDAAPGASAPSAPPLPVAAPMPDLPGITPAVARSETGQILVPAGRGIYAHPILKLSSDNGGPVVLQADSGLIAGDRMIGSFTQQGNRLIIKIDTVIHRGEPISAPGFVVAPGTMEAGVASDVDQNLLSRFVLPAAAAFVQGLGSAIATTSNNVSVLSPLGGATTTSNLNLNQQLGIAAGVAASNVGSSLNASAPRGPTVTLDAGVTVGVMFLSNVATRGQR